MKLFNRFSKRSKVLLGVALAVIATAIVAVPGFSHAALGSDRQTKAYVQGMAGFDHVQFNSFTGVPNIGDERNFFNGMIDGANGGFYDPMNGVRSGDQLLVRVYVHNNADSSLNASGTGVAKNTRVRVALPTGVAQNQTASAFISADNAQPQTIEDTLSLTGETPVGLSYVPGSATIKTNYQDKALGDNIVTDGVLIGDDNLNGNQKGCFDYVALVTFKVKVTTPGFSLQKQVRMNGTTAWNKQVTAKAGDKVDFSLSFKNTGGNTLNKVVLGDRLPVGLSYVSGSSMWAAGSTNNQWTPVAYDQWMNGGLNVGNYAGGATAYLKFTATIDDSKLQCGLNRVTNIGFAKPENEGTIQDSAEVDVTKTCATPTPSYSCDLLELNKVDHIVTVKTFNQTAKDGATFKNVVIDWGDGTSLMTDKAVGQTHTFTGNGPFTVKAVPHFTVNGTDQTAEGANCVQTVSFTTPVTPAAAQTPPATLANAGAGNVVGLFAAVSAIGFAFHRFVLSRRFAR